MWCVGGGGPDHEHFSEVVKVAGASLLVELSMDPEEERVPHVAILPEHGGVGLRLGVAQAVQLACALVEVAMPALPRVGGGAGR